MLVDVHAHFDQYHEQLQKALDQLEEYSINTIAVSMDTASYERTCELAEKSPRLLPVFGIHPWEAYRYEGAIKNGRRVEETEKTGSFIEQGELEEHLRQTPMIGEAGLDFHWVRKRNRWEQQITVFSFLCEWAGRHGLPMNLHTKGAEQEVLDMLRKYAVERSIVHWYSGPVELIEAYLDAGCFFSIGCEVITSEHIQKILRRIPLSRLLLETDNPGGYEWLYGKIGMPRHLYDTSVIVSELLGIPHDELEEQLMENWEGFGISFKQE